MSHDAPTTRTSDTPTFDTPTGTPDIGAQVAAIATAARDWHLPGLTGVEAVKTAAMRDAHASLGRALRADGIAAVSGAAGNGKTFAVNNFLHHHSAAESRPKLWLDIPQNPTPKEVTMRLLTLLGVRFSTREPQYTLTNDLVEHLVGRRLVVVIDEAHHLGAKGLQQLRYFHDSCQPRAAGGPGGFALVLIGSDVDRALAGAAELGSRVTSWVKFSPMTPEDMIRALHSWHPLMGSLPTRTLLDYDRQFGRGHWRNWAQFLAALLDTYTRAEQRSAERDQPMPDLDQLAAAARTEMRGVLR